MYSLSIIIPTYNSEKTIKDCLDSIISQTYTDYEVLIMDGVSSDNTINIVKEYKNSNIHIFSEKDTGVYDAMNKGIDKSNGKWLYFLGSDDRLYDNNVLKDIISFISENDCNVAYGNAYFIGKEKFHAGYFTRERLNKQINICHQAIFYQKEIFYRLGQYNLHFSIYADWDFNIRCFSTPDLKICYYDRTIVFYNDLSGISTSKDDWYFKEIYSFDELNKKSELELENMFLKNILSSKDYKIGNIILKPLRFLKRLAKKIL